MSVIVRSASVASQLTALLCREGFGPMLLHSDLLRIGVLDRAKSRTEMLEDYRQLLLHCLDGRPLLVPTFNYAFCRTGIYDPSVDRSEVGALTEHWRAAGAPRTLTPVFNFCLSNADDFEQSHPSVNPFDEGSTFGLLVRRNATVVFLGAPLHANTMIHYVEEIAQIGYRYIKRFPGIVILKEGVLETTLHYRVRPLLPFAVEYDWPRLTDDLARVGILRCAEVGNGTALCYRAQDLVEYWSIMLDQDEMFLLTDRSRAATKELYQRHGRPLHWEKLEAGT